LNKIIKEDESIIKNLENERNKVLNINNDLKIEAKELKNSLRSKEDTISFQKKQLDDANINMNKLENLIREFELKNSELKNELTDKAYIVQKESRIRNDREKDIDSLSKIIKDKERDFKKAFDDLHFVQNEKDKLYEDNTRMFNELDRLKKHIYIITDQNQQVLNILINIKY